MKTKTKTAKTVAAKGASKAKAKTNGKTAKGIVAKPAKAKADHVPLELDGKTKLKSIDMSAYRSKSSLVAKRFAGLKPGMTIDQAVEKGVSRYDLACALQRGRVSFAK